MPDPTTEDLAQLRDQLRAEIREAHGVLKDLRREIRDARTLIPLLMDDIFETEVSRRLRTLGEETQRTTAEAADRVIARFDQLYDQLMGQDPKSRRQGQTPIPDLLKSAVALQRDQDATR